MVTSRSAPYISVRTNPDVPQRHAAGATTPGRSGQSRLSVAPDAAMSHDMTSFVPHRENAQDLRRAFSCFATGVTVITVQTDTGPLGMTANSFSSVSLDPPLILWSPALMSRRHDSFAKATHFCVHILAHEQQHLARHFATQGHDFDALDWSEGHDGVPLIGGCLATLQCSTHAVYPAGDHSVILGQVRHAALRKGLGDGLIFNQGSFGTFTPQD